MIIVEQVEQLENEARRLYQLANTTLDGQEADRLRLEADAKRVRARQLRQRRTDGVRFG